MHDPHSTVWFGKNSRTSDSGRLPLAWVTGSPLFSHYRVPVSACCMTSLSRHSSPSLYTFLKHLPNQGAPLNSNQEGPVGLATSKTAGPTAQTYKVLQIEKF
jgi:hypothetical protein